jgi:uncharacterized HAD superfamily protein
MVGGIIAVDIDDVLSRSVDGFVDYSNKKWNLNITVDDYTEDWAAVWSVPLEEGVKRSLAYNKSDIFGRFKHYEDAVPVLQKLRTRYELVIVTSRRRILQAETESWLDKHFPGLFSAIHYVGIWDDLTKDDAHHRLNRTKTAICKEIGANYLIDDQLKHCIAAAEAGLEVLLFGAYRWNDHAGLPKRITRVDDWKTIEEYFDAKS